MSRSSKSYEFSVFVTSFFLVLLVAGLGLAGNVLAAVVRVPTDQPTIQKAVDAAKKGDTVRVSQGKYDENVTMKEGVTLEGGWNKDFSSRDISVYETIIDGGKNGGWVVCGASDATLDGFTIINGRRVEMEGETVGAGLHCRSTSPTIINNTIKSNGPAGIFCSGSSAIIRNNVISDNEEAGIYVENGSSVQIQGNTISENKMAGIGSGGMVTSTFEIRNNTIHNNGMAGIEGKAARGNIFNNLIYENNQTGIRCVIAPTDIVNNTVVANTRSGIVVEHPSVVPTIRNNIITHNGDAGIRAAGEGYSHNLLFANNQTEGCDPRYLWCVRRQYGGYEDEESFLKHKGLIADPLYVDAVNHNYHLRPTSPAIDAGDPDSKFDDVHFPPSMGFSVNDLGAYGGPFAVSEERRPNDPPVANAGLAQEVYLGEKVTLDGAGSTDPNGDFLSYQWTFVSKPEASSAELASPTKARSSFKADAVGDYVVQLIVQDRWGESSEPHTVSISTLSNHPPVANAGEVISNVFVGDKVTLFGGASKDPDGDPLQYRWELSFGPSGSQATLSDVNAVSPTFVVDALGCYMAELVVSDGKAESLKERVYVSTKHDAVDGKRNVPAEYPTIQTAVDAANPGDDVIVQKGVYKEKIVLDKNVDLIGVDWPEVDGGSEEGNTNTIMIPYLGARAVRIEGFVITGGGDGPMGHGINLWDSSAVIVNNKITRNRHNAIGVHGVEMLTGRAEIYDNHIYDNMNGIGNGRGSKAHIHNNYIYDNRVVGVGSRGLAAPYVESNYIYGNHIGVGCREVASPRIEGNHIYDNVCGIVIGPMSTIKTVAGEDIVIKNNLLFGNHQCGISITSFNLSNVVITNNTVDSNNLKYEKQERGGGVIFGYPYPGSFSVFLKNNIITNNKIGGVVNYTGTELYPEPGANITNDYNNLWNNGNDYAGCAPGHKSFSEDPIFVPLASVENGRYFLSQTAAGQDFNSPCVDAGDDDSGKSGLRDKTTRTDDIGDGGVLDLGYHYPRPSAEQGATKSK